MYMYVDDSDVQILGKTHNITITPENCVHTLRFIVTRDGVAQEGNETFFLLISNFHPTLLGENTSFIRKMNGTIQDNDGT